MDADVDAGMGMERDVVIATGSAHAGGADTGSMLSGLASPVIFARAVYRSVLVASAADAVKSVQNPNFCEFLSNDDQSITVCSRQPFEFVVVSH